MSHDGLPLTFSVPAWDFQHGTRAADGEGIRPETVTGMAERQQTESPPDEESWGVGQRFKSRSDPKPPSLGVWLFIDILYIVAVVIVRTINSRTKKKRRNQISWNLI